MQMFFLKNLVGVSSVAVVLGGISIASMAQQSNTPANQQRPDAGQMNTSNTVTQDAHFPVPDVNTILHPAPDSEKVYEEMVADESNPLLTEGVGADESAVDRVQERLNMLNEGGKMSESPPISGDNEILKGPDANALGVSPDDAGAVKPDETVPVLPDTPSSDVSEQPTSPTTSKGMDEMGMPKLIVAPRAWDDEQSRKQHPDSPKPYDPTDPDSVPSGKHGKSKGGPKMIDPKVIPIIRMGENSSQEGAFTIIKTWDN